MNRVNEVTRDVLSAVAQVRHSDEESLGEPETLHRHLRTLVNNSMQTATEQGFSHPDAQDIGYVLAALVDEVVLLKGGALRDYWLAHMLQLELFNDNIAGERVFDRLEELLRDSSRAETLQVYHLALLLGFQGKYRVQGGELALASTIDRVSDAVRRSGAHSDLELSPHGARPAAELLGKHSGRSLVWAALGALGFAFCLYGLMAWSLSSRVADLDEGFERLSAELE